MDHFHGGASGGSSDTEQDYLQDPELWEDRLPQPYRMIQRIIEAFLDDTWEYIEHLEICRQQEAAQVKIPEGTKGEFWCKETLNQSHGGVCSGRDVVFVGNDKHIFVVRCDSKAHGEVIANQSLECDVVSLEVIRVEEVCIVLVQHIAG